MTDPLKEMRRSWAERQLPAGIADRYTWQTRMIRLVPDWHFHELVVPRIFFTQGRSPQTYDDDPMSAYARGKESDPWDSISLRRDKAAWRDSHALLTSGPRVRQPQAVNHVAAMVESGALTADDYALHIAGIARGKEAAKQILWRHDRFPAPMALLKDADLAERLGTMLQSSEIAGKGLNASCRVLCANYLVPGFDMMAKDKQRELLRPNPKHPTDIDCLSKEIDPRRSYWARMEGHFYALLRELPADKDAASERWRAAVEREAKKAFKESADQLGQSARAIRARALVNPSLRPRANNACNGESNQKEVIA
jgi:hypothetical protein